MSLDRETRWSRLYQSADGRCTRFESRFLDGTATVTLGELQEEWPRWNEHERLDFCQAFACGADVPGRENILRFLVRHADHIVHSTVALSVAMWLPAREAVSILKEWCLTGEVGQCANYFQALALTKDPAALDFLRECFRRVWNSEGLMATADFQNWIASDAMWCIKNMVELGEDTDALRPAYETLKTHPCPGTREQTQSWLSEHFEVAPEPAPRSGWLADERDPKQRLGVNCG